MTEVASNVAKFRRERGISASQLAAAVGVSRQTIYAIEAGTYVPNTAVSLHLARALETTVEQLFSLTDDSSPQPRSETPTLIPGGTIPANGQVVQLCRVDGKLMASYSSPVTWAFPHADAVVIDSSRKAGRAPVNVFAADEKFDGRVLIAGCDPGISVLSRHVQSAGAQMVLAHRNSSQALSLLEQGYVHIAGTHLRDQATGESNLSEIRRRFSKGSVAVISFAVWEQGLLTSANNPKGIRGVEDLARPDVSIVNREEGSGSRALLDAQLTKLAMSPKQIRGFDQMASGHLAAAWQVHSGIADCCLATRAAARVYALHFLPLVSERYDLVIRKKHLNLTQVQSLLNALSRSGFRRELASYGGYDTAVAGRRVE